LNPRGTVEDITLTTREQRMNLERTSSERRANAEKNRKMLTKNRHGAYGSEDKRGAKMATKSLLFVWLEQRMNREKKGVKKPFLFHLKQERTKRKERLAREQKREGKALREGGISSCLCCECKCRANCSKANKTP